MIGKLFTSHDKIFIQLPDFLDLPTATNQNPELNRYYSNDLGQNLSDFLIFEQEELNEMLAEFLELAVSVVLELPTNPYASTKIVLDADETKNTFVLVFKLHIFQFLVSMAFQENPEGILNYIEAFYALDMYKQDDLYTKLSKADRSKGNIVFYKYLATVIKDLIVRETINMQTFINNELKETEHNSHYLNDIIIAKLFKISYAFDWDSMGSSHGTHFITEFAPAFTKKKDLGNVPEIELVMVQKYFFNNLFSLVYLEYYEATRCNIEIKPCRYCKRLFIPEGRSDKEYCDNIAPGENLPCSQIGATKLHYKEKEDDPVYTAFLTAYRRMRSRVRTNKLTKEEFTEWSQVARSKRDACYDNELDFDEFKEWLSSNKIS